MTARDIQRLLIGARYRESFTMPNFTPAGWYECDVMEITPAGYFVEYEIKISLSDFRQDAKKRKEKITYKRKPDAGLTFAMETVSTKHGQLGDKAPAAPSRFWYVCPEGLIKPEMLPAWAGLIYVRGWSHEGIAGLIEYVKVKAPRIHNELAAPDLKTKAQAACYWRLNALFTRENCECSQTALMKSCQHVKITSKLAKKGLVQFICEKCRKVIAEKPMETILHERFNFIKTPAEDT